MVNYDIPRQYLIFRDTFLIFILIRRRVTFKLSVFHFWQTNFASYED